MQSPIRTSSAGCGATQGPVQAEFPNRLGHAQDEQRLGLVGAQPA
jgi:hypothetical protein